MNEKPSKIFVINKIAQLAEKNPKIKVLDLGSGQSRNFLPLFEKNPELQYTGIEPSNAAKKAAELLNKYPNARIIQSPAYTGFEELNAQFDIVVSLSVLEHIRKLEQFLEFSVKKLKKGGTLIHLYDLGHYLYPSNMLERLQTIFCSTPGLKKLAPELKFAAYVNQESVEKFLKQNGIKIERITYHNMPSNVEFAKQLEDTPQARNAIHKIAEIEAELSEIADKIPVKKREKLFPSICIWGKK